MNSRKIVIAAFIAALYFASTMMLHPISYGPIQMRLATALAGAVPIYGWTAIMGFVIGQLISNVFSPLGPIDLLSPIASGSGMILTMYLYRVTKRDVSVLMGLTIMSMFLTAWVSFMLQVVLNVPWIATFVYLLIGI
ncbi:MAG: QueT transporter family protein [Candidatus Methanomethylicaceae archaeon]